VSQRSVTLRDAVDDGSWFKQASQAALVAMADAIGNALPALGPRGALDNIDAIVVRASP
jgi:hypothetical protein